jgi:multidrug efflux pump subunit AcrB
LHDHDGKKQNRYRKRIDGFVEWLRIDCMGRAVNFLLPHRKLVFTSILSVFILSIGLIGTGRIKIQGFPELEGDVVVARLLMSEGTPLGRTESVVGSIHQALEKTNRKFSALQPQGKELVDIACVEFGTNVDAYSSGAHTATITVGLLSAEKRLGTIDEYLTYWREEIGDIPDIVSLTISEPGFGPAGRAIEVRLRGKNLTELKDAANDLQAWMHQYKGVINLTHDMRVGKPEISLKMREESYGLGITAIQAARQISAAFKGITVDDIQIGSESYEIDVRLADYDTNSLQKLENFILISNGGQEIPLINVAEWKMARGWAHIGRFNGMRSATITGDVDTRLINVNELMSLMKKRFLPAFSQKYPQTQLTIAGELEQTSLTRMSMLRALLIGIVVIFVLLSFQFKSYTEPFIVMIAIPFTLIGVIWGHLFMGIPVSMPSLMGFIALAGVVVNDSILLVLFLKNSRARGNSIVEAAGRASRERFRAVLLTSSTTIAGVLPILLEKSLQAQILKPLVISTAFGIAASTLLVLLGLPCMYLLLNDLGLICEE